MRPRRRAVTAAAAAALAVLLPLAAAQGGEALFYRYTDAVRCPQLTLAALGADATGAADVVPVLQRTEAYLPGIHFVSPGRYRVDRNVTLLKPVIVERGGVFVVQAGATLAITQPLTAGAYPVFEGPGRVVVSSTVSLMPEWFGAQGNTPTFDDAPAINRALQAANDSDAELLFSGKTYYVGVTLHKGQGTRVFSYPGATLRALRPGMLGVYYEAQGHIRPDLLPSLVGFETGIWFDDVGMTDAYVPLITDAPGQPCKVGMRMNADSTRMKFGTIRDCATGLWVTTDNPDIVIMQGFTTEGGEYVDTKGVAKEVYRFTAPNLARPPWWDHDYNSIGRVVVHPNATGFALVRSNLTPDVKFGLPHHTYILGEMSALPAGSQLLATNLWDCVVKLRPTAPFLEGQLDNANSDFNSIVFEGPGPANFSQPLLLTEVPDSLAVFKSQNNLGVAPWQNYLMLQLPQTTWDAGQTRRFFLYHQLAYRGQQLFLTVPGWGASCIDGNLAVTAITDNSLANDVVTGGHKYEVVIDVVACRAFSGAVNFPIALGAVSS